jgi:hypothetical protein
MLLKASEDFKRRTLGALPTLLEKLAYICAIQTSEGRYEHWGLSRVFGADAAQKAILEAHAETAVELARSPLREIYKDMLEIMDGPLGQDVMKPESFVLKTPANGDELLSAHLRLIQDSVAALAQHENKAHRVA